MKVSEDEQPEDDDLVVTAEEGIISVNDEVIYIRRSTIKIKTTFLYSRHVSKKNLFDYFVFFLTRRN